MATARKSALRSVASANRSTSGDQHHSPALTADLGVKMRAATLREFEAFLRTTTNNRGRPYAPRTVEAYTQASRVLSRWMSREGMHGDFTEIDTPTLNRFFRDYWREHDAQHDDGYTGGTCVTQRNLRALFKWLAEELDVPDPWRDPKFRRYAAPKVGKPKTLSEDFIADVLTVTGNGRAKDFETVRDHAILRVLTEGLRAEELLSLTLDLLHLDQGVLLVVPLKDARGGKTGRLIGLQPKTVRALRRYLRVRATHRQAGTSALWLGTRNRGQLGYTGLRLMVKRRTTQAGYDPKEVGVHAWRHTSADDLLSAGVSGENVMQHHGWKDPSMLRRYAADMASERAMSAVRKLGDRY